MKLEKAASQLEALGNPTRLNIYRILVRAGEAGLPVGRIQSKLDIPASTLSHHCKRLVDVGPRDAGAAGDDADLPRPLSGDECPDRLSRRRMLRGWLCAPPRRQRELA